MRVATILVGVALAVAGVLSTGWVDREWFDEDDYSVALSAPGAREAAAVAREVVPGDVVGITRDRDNGKWEVLVDQGGRRYEVELGAEDYGLLRLDYD